MRRNNLGTIKKAVVGFIDILGYKDIVKRHKSNIKAIRGMENIITGASKMMDKLRKIKIDNPEIRNRYNQFNKRMTVRFITDAIIFTLTLPGNNQFADDSERNTVISDNIDMYLKNISMALPFIISKLGLILRGGISIGYHYENDYSSQKNNLFIFSEAYMNAVILEEKKAGLARVIIDPKLVEYLGEVSFNKEDKYFYSDSDYKCFDFYCALNKYNGRKMVLRQIMDGVTLNYKTVENNENAKEKLQYFIDYHNRKVKEMGFPNFRIINN